jgi:DNA-binding response OmpR family regulator
VADLLIVDDDEDVILPMRLFLKKRGHAVRYAADGEEGLVEIKKKCPDLILLDVEMPGLTGPEMAYRLLLRDAGHEKIPILLLSGVSFLEHMAAQVGTPYYLSKPFGFAEFGALLERAMRERLPPRPKMQSNKL